MKPAPDAAGCVVLLHGLGRSRASMAGMARYLRRAGYPVLNLGYPSRRHGIDHLVRSYLAPAVRRCTAQHGGPLHFVTHSLGGILLRHYLATHSLPEGSRAVLLAPPNRGSVVAEGLRALPLPDCLLGPAARELGTGPGSVPLVLGPARLEIGVIAGTRSVEPWFGRWLAQASDGKVGVAETRLEGMQDWCAVPATHTFIMNHPQARQATLRFLRSGRFAPLSQAAGEGGAR